MSGNQGESCLVPRPSHHSVFDHTLQAITNWMVGRSAAGNEVRLRVEVHCTVDAATLLPWRQRVNLSRACSAFCLTTEYLTLPVCIHDGQYVSDSTHMVKQDGCLVAVPKHLHTAGTISEARNAKLLGLTSVTNLGMPCILDLNYECVT